LRGCDPLHSALAMHLLRSLGRRVTALPAQHRRPPVLSQQRSMASGSKSTYDIWFGDAGTYPVIVIISGAVVFCAGYFSYNILTNPDIRVSKSKRRDTVIRTWER